MLYKKEYLDEIASREKSKNDKAKFMALLTDRVGYMRFDSLADCWVRNEGSVAKLGSKDHIDTPTWLVNEMVAAIPAHVFSNKDSKVLDPACGDGTFLYAVFNRFFTGLAKEIPDRYERACWIWQNCLYGTDTNKAAIGFIKWIVSQKLGIQVDKGIITQDFLRWDTDMKFDVVVGNPPYQGGLVNGLIKSTAPIYPDFIKKSLSLSSQYTLMICPHKWVLGHRLSDFKKKIVEQSGLRSVNFFTEGQMVFGSGVELKGGVSYILCEAGYLGNFTYTDSNSKIEIAQKADLFNRFTNSLLPSILSKTVGKKYDSIYKRNSNITSKDSRFSKSGLTVYMSKNKVGFIDQSAISDARDHGSWKVLFPRASSGNDLAQKAIVASPDSTSTESFWFIKCKSQQQALNLISYFDTVFSKFLICAFQASHNINSPVLRNLPECPDLDKQWNDKEIRSHFKITQEEEDWMASCIKDFNIDDQ